MGAFFGDIFNIRIKKSLEIFKILLKNPTYLLRGWYSDVLEQAKQEDVIKRYGLTNGLPTVDLIDLVPHFKEIVDPYSYLTETSPPMDIAFLMSLARQYKNCKYLEIGTWRGESLANVSKVAKECVSISLSDEELRKWGHPEKYIKLQRFYSKGLKNVLHINHNSLTFDYSKLNKKFDLIFVDGDHRYTSVKIDTQNVFRLLKDENSVIVWHDCGADTEGVKWSVLAGILDGCPPEKRKNLYRVSNTMCAIYMTKKIKHEFLTFPQTPNKNFKIKINSRKLNKKTK
ncbi:MAG: class I SAM-dependent methyltransferase [Nanoarchaeota archaeon]